MQEIQRMRVKDGFTFLRHVSFHSVSKTSSFSKHSPGFVNLHPVSFCNAYRGAIRERDELTFGLCL